VEDALDAHQRPKLERYGGTLFVVLKPARYLDDVERVEFGEIHIFFGELRHHRPPRESPDVGMVRQSLEAELLRRGPEAILHAIMDRIVDDYGPVVDGLENDIQEIEAEVFGGTRTSPGASTSCRAR
jgi:magnesium transporter